MKRLNKFGIVFKHPERALNLAKGCATLWNVVNYKRRQSFFKGEINWNTDMEYDDFKGWVGSATAQSIIRKNNDAWKSFFVLLKAKEAGKLPDEMKHIGLPYYWKDRRKKKFIPKILFRNDSYKIQGRNIKFPLGFKGRLKGKPRWEGKQGQLELRYDNNKWHVYQPVDGIEPRHQPIGHKTAYVDIGVRYIMDTLIEGNIKTIAYNGTPLLSDWWYWNKLIGEHQSILNTVNKSHSSDRLTKLYRIRKLRFRQAINTYIYQFVKSAYEQGADTVVAGDLKGIRNNNGSKGKKTNAMTNNFWSHKYISDRLRWTCENFGLKLELVNERKTSSVCPRCGSDRIVKCGRLFKCQNCKLEAHRDTVGVFNISLVHQAIPLGEGDGNWVMAHPEVVNDFQSFHNTNNLEGISLL